MRRPREGKATIDQISRDNIECWTRGCGSRNGKLVKVAVKVTGTVEFLETDSMENIAAEKALAPISATWTSIHRATREW